MIGETKRPGAPPPALARGGTGITDVPSAVSQGVSGERMQGDWSKWMPKLTSYVREVASRWRTLPGRVWISDGNWLVIFKDPKDAFLSTSRPDPNRIEWYSEWDEIRRRANDVIAALEYYRVLGEAPGILSASLPFFVEEGEITAVMHGLRVVYQDVRQVYGPDVSIIHVAAVLFLRTRRGAWLRVEAFAPTHGHALPKTDASGELTRHLQDVEAAARKLRREVEEQLGYVPPTLTLAQHYEDRPFFERLPGMRPDGRDVFLVATGADTHFLRLTPTVADCRWHDWEACRGNGFAEGDAPAEFASKRRRALFLSKLPHHCAHSHVMAAKTGPVSVENRDRCGPRSAEVGGAFCEVFSFEQHLCCRTCVFEDVCTASPVFRLPCVRPTARGRPNRQTGLDGSSSPGHLPSSARATGT